MGYRTYFHFRYDLKNKKDYLIIPGPALPNFLPELN
jgi:hypothetical protein